MKHNELVRTLSFEEIQSISGGENFASSAQHAGLLAGLALRPSWGRERSAISALLKNSQSPDDIKILERLAGDFAGKVDVSSILQSNNLKMGSLNNSMQKLLQTIQR